MEEIILITLLLMAGAYFLTHQQEETKSEKPFTTSLSTQTDPLIDEAARAEQKALESTLDTLIKEIKQLNRELK
jgi:uncharacterized lipoprotein YmbA